MGSMTLMPTAVCQSGDTGADEADAGISGTTSLIPQNTTFRRQGFTIPCFSYVGPEALERSLKDAAKTGANSVIFDYHLDRNRLRARIRP
jgi:hypothetical protein